MKGTKIFLKKKKKKKRQYHCDQNKNLSEEGKQKTSEYMINYYLINYYLSDPFTFTPGVCQGCRLSLLLYIAAAGVLATFIDKD